MRQERLAEEDILHQLRDHSQKPVKTKSVYYVSLPTEEAHHPTHPTRGANMMAQRVNPHIAARISELVGERMMEPYEVSKALKHYVTTVLCASSNNPDPYYPTIRDLRNHIYKAKKALELSKLDQENFKLKTEEWKNLNQILLFTFSHLSKLNSLKKI